MQNSIQLSVGNLKVAKSSFQLFQRVYHQITYYIYNNLCIVINQSISLMNHPNKENSKQLQNGHKFWCHFCQKQFQSKLKPGSDIIKCCICHNDYCELVTINSCPQKFEPFQKQPIKKQKNMYKINPQMRKVTINQLMQILQIQQAQSFKLTEQMVDKLRKKTTKNTECSVCRQEILANEDALIPKCEHAFHEQCVRQWIQRKNTCPTCRGQIVQVQKQN